MTEDISLPDLPTHLATMLGTSEFVAGLIATGIFLMLFLIPIIFLTRGKNLLLPLLTGFLTMCICVALTWLPVWVLIMLVLLTALMMSGQARKWITGQSGE